MFCGMEVEYQISTQMIGGSIPGSEVEFFFSKNFFELARSPIWRYLAIFGEKIKYSSKCLKLPNLARNTIKKFLGMPTCARGAARARWRG